MPTLNHSTHRENKIFPFGNHFFQMGRHAMRVGLDILAIDKGSTVLIPCSLCPAVLEPLVNYGLKIKLYSLDKNLNWDIKQLSKLITSDVSGIYVIHYFGIWYDLSSLRILCDKMGIFLIEDCALCDYNKNSPIGTVGDIAIFSLWKFYPISDGAILKINIKRVFNITKFIYPAFISTFIKNIKIKLKGLGIRGLIPFWVIKIWLIKNLTKNSISSYCSQDEYIFKDDLIIYSMSKNNRNRLKHFDFIWTLKKRLENFQRMLDFCINNGIEVLYDEIPNGSTPYCFPIIIKNHVEIQKELLRVGIQTEISINKPIRGKYYQIETEINYIELNQMSDSVLSLPIHQDIGDEKLNYIQSELLKLI